MSWRCPATNACKEHIVGYWYTVNAGFWNALVRDAVAAVVAGCCTTINRDVDRDASSRHDRQITNQPIMQVTDQRSR